MDWSPPSLNGLKFNVDGSARGKPDLAGIGGVLRDFRDSNTAKILSIHRASAIFAFRPDFVGKEIVIASDSKSAVAWVNNADGISSFKHMDFIYDICNYLKFLGNSSVVYNPRSFNSFADNLAKMGSSKDNIALIKIGLVN
ncbi:hypothetical protein Dsin_007580 [Dipteronia sinensis]|uniref:RNase H type-1 domain-containing protein n=1 Tax=Dipteronia sinensis TaxID=43782 RepID=A0AAE0B1D2_9ROSI|nr:hypothetical protein Dsin_007580 [Dipteronia sinensis]